MFDDLAAKAVIGSPLGDTQNKFERFYVSLAMRGWNDLIKDLRVVLREYRMQPLIAERAIDKYLMLVGMTESERDRVCGYVNSFLSGLPSECSDTLIRAGEEISELLENGAVLHRNTATDRQNLKARLEEFRAFKNEIE